MPEGPKLTPSQAQAVTTTGQSILVSASAGTGKTHVLAQRCAHLVCDASPPCDVDRLLVVTFTEAAAAEMRARIGQVIRQRLDARPGDGRLRRQLALLDAATITTIHAFCLEVLRRHFLRAELDPNLDVLDADEATLLQEETLDALFDEMFTAGHDEPLGRAFRRLVDEYGQGRDRRVRGMVLTLHAFVNSLPDPDGWLEAATQAVAARGGSTLPQAQRKQRIEVLAHRMEMLSETAGVEADFIRRCELPGEDYAELLDKLGAHLEGCRKTLLAATKDREVDGVLDVLEGYAFGRAKSVRGLDDEGKARRGMAKESWERLRERYRKDLAHCAGVFRTGAVLDGLRRVGPHVATLVELTRAFDQRFQAAKQHEGRIDFNDLERYALSVLSADAAGATPSAEAALEMQDKYEHVLVDEFQDVNPIQRAILGLVSREGDAGRADNLFSVGDVKQSIYRFRLAEPEIFVRRAAAFVSGRGAKEEASDPSPGRLIHLRENFRSRGEILEAVNVLFRRIMEPSLCDMAYDSGAELVAGAAYPAGVDPGFGRPAAELHLIEASLEPTEPEDGEGVESITDWLAIEREAYLAGRRILELMGQVPGHQRAQVCAKNTDPDAPPLRVRPLELRDIVILLRSTKGKANHFERILREMGIPVFGDLSAGYFSSLEVQDVLALLRLMDNGRQDIPLATVLRSPLLDEPLSESQLSEIRLADRRIPFHEAARKAAVESDDPAVRGALTDLYDRLRRWRERLRREPLAEVLWAVLQETGYLAYVGGLRNGLQRRANLIRLHERARQFASFARQGLGRFLTFLDELEQQGLDPGVAPAISEAEDVVRVMSIHRSKGLEFPVVIVPDLAKRINFEDAQRVMMFDRKHYIGLSAVDLDAGVRYPTLSSLAVSEELRRQIRAEEMRILYVAMTRARERLILIGTMKLEKADAERLRGRLTPERMDLLQLASANTMLDWVLPAVARMSDEQAIWSDAPRPDADEAALYTVHRHDSQAIEGWDAEATLMAEADADLERFARLEPVDGAPADDPAVQHVLTKARSPGLAMGLSNVPAVVAASELKRRLALDHEPDERRAALPFAQPTLDRPRLSRERSGEEDGLSASEVGTAMHAALEHLDLTRPCDAADIAEQVGGMVRRGVLTEQERRALSLESLAWLFTTDLGGRMRASPERVLREVPFVLGLEPERIAPGLEAESDGDVVLVRGMIDCVLQGDDGDEVIDFKTDAIRQDQLEERTAHYRPQVDIYTEAIERVWRRRVRARWLAFLSVPAVVEVARSCRQRTL